MWRCLFCSCSLDNLVWKSHIHALEKKQMFLKDPGVSLEGFCSCVKEKFILLDWHFSCSTYWSQVALFVWILQGRGMQAGAH